MPVEDVFSIAGRGTVVTGGVEQGKVKTGDDVEIVGIKDAPTKTTVTGKWCRSKATVCLGVEGDRPCELGD